ncbi:MAG: multicopper oxidase domain-containing protein, partial [Persicimonas sp.]
MFAILTNHTPSKWRLLTVLLLSAAMLSVTACKSNSSETSTTDEPSETGEVKEFTLEAYMSGYKGVSGDIDGEINPDLKVDKGDTVKVTLINKENMAHDFAVEGPDLKSESLMKVNERTTLEFTAESNDTYFCSIPGHRQAGMEGKIVVSGGSQPVAKDDGQDGLIPAASNSLKEAKKVSIDEVGWDASELPAPLDRKHNKKVEFVIETEEVVAELEDGTTYEMWTYDGKVPGPMLRVKEGDDVVVHVDNAEDSSMSHSIDFHSVTGPGGGAAVLQVPPGERRSLQFKALQAGLYVYHCATPHIPTHLARGMYGMILVEPKEGLEPVDKEFYVMQGEY